MKSLIAFFLIAKLFAGDIDPAKMLMPLKKDLMKNLTGKMKSGGPIAALEFCHLEVQKITGSHQGKGISLGRTSHKLRNPKNAPKDWVKPYLEEFVSGKRSEPVFVSLKNGQKGYLEPIKIGKPACLICHGKGITKPVQAELEKRYPEDEATGFKMGDFRGLFWVEY